MPSKTLVPTEHKMFISIHGHIGSNEHDLSTTVKTLAQIILLFY